MRANDMAAHRPTVGVTSLEHRLATELLHPSRRPVIRTVRSGRALVNQGDGGAHLFVVLDGLLDVEHDGVVIARYGPGSVLGERAVLRGGRRTATMRAVGRCRVACVVGRQVDRSLLLGLAAGRGRELESIGA